MKNCFTEALVACLFVAGPLDVFAQDPATARGLDSAALTKAVATALDRAGAKTATLPASRLRVQQSLQRDKWIKRHPILFGTAVGCGAGLLLGKPVRVAMDLPRQLGFPITCGIGAGALVAMLVGR